jgi:hypothetical protein
MRRICGFRAASLADQKQDLVAGIDQRVNGFGEHRRRSRDPGGPEFRERDRAVADQGDDYNPS